jgi:phosphoglycolate phosphatase
MLHLTDALADKLHIIWDWNGTLLDDLDLCVGIIGELLAEHGLEPIDRATYLEGFRFPVIDYYRELGFDFDRASFAELTKGFISRYAAKAASVGLFDGAVATLAALKERGAKCSVLSAAHEKDLVALLRHHGILDYL